jgi:phage tail-like protein
MCAQKSSVQQRKDPYGNYRFRVEISGIAQVAFAEVIMPDSASEVIEHREGTDPANVRKQSGLLTHSSLILKWGLTAAIDLYNWRKDIEQGKIGSSRRNIIVTLIDEEGKDAAVWKFVNAWPSAYKAPDLNAKGNEVAVETLEIVFESMVREK